MERVRDPDEAERAAAVGDQQESLLVPGLEAYLTSDVLLDLLKLPKDGLIKINAALLFLGNEEMFAYYRRDEQYGGEPRCKLVAADAVRAAFHAMPFESGWMPPGTLRFGISATGTRWLSIFVPPGRRMIQVVDNDLGLLSVEVPLPGFVFTGYGRDYWIWAVKDESVTAQTGLYHAPLSNVDADGRICFGVNSVPEADGATILQAFHLFIESPFNGHTAASKSRKHKGDVRYQLTELAAQHAECYPLDDLLGMAATRDHAGEVVTLDRLLTALLRLQQRRN